MSTTNHPINTPFFLLKLPKYPQEVSCVFRLRLALASFFIIFLSLAIFAQSVGISESSRQPDPSSILDIQPNVTLNKGLLIPRLTTAQRNSIPTPAHSLIIFNITTDCLEIYNAATQQWVSLGCQNCQLPGSFRAKSATGISQFSFKARWDYSSAAVSYFIDVSTDAAFTFILPEYNNLHVGDTNEFIVNNVDCFTTYYYRLRAQNECGTTPVTNTISVTTLTCPTMSERCILIGGDYVDYSFSIFHTRDGGYVSAGYTYSFGVGNPGGSFADAYLLKLNRNGQLQWTRTLGGSHHEFLFGVVQTLDGGYCTVGETYSFYNGDRNAFITKLNQAGNVVWSRVIGGSGIEFYKATYQTSDGSLLAVGLTTSFGATSGDAFIQKWSSSGDLVWSKLIGGSNTERFESVVAMNDGSIFCAGMTNSFGAGNYDLYLVKLSADGDLVWTRTIGSAGNENASQLSISPDGNLVIGGFTNFSGAGGYDYLIVKMSAQGELIWAKTIGGTSNEYLRSLTCSPAGDIVAVGSTQSFGAFTGDVYAVKLSSLGELLWTRMLGSYEQDLGSSVVNSSDNGFVISGYSKSYDSWDGNIFINKLNNDGFTCTPDCMNGTGGSIGTPPISISSGGSIISEGTATIINPTIGSGGTLRSTLCSQ